jgi:hypothetical protein
VLQDQSVPQVQQDHKEFKAKKDQLERQAPSVPLAMSDQQVPQDHKEFKAMSAQQVSLAQLVRQVPQAHKVSKEFKAILDQQVKQD